jgi:ankyrin repeat protein
MSRGSIVIAVLALLLSQPGCAPTADTPQAKLAERNIEYTPDKFLESAAEANMVALNLFLEAGMDVNVKDVYGGTALRYASYNGHVDAVKTLIDRGAEINVQDTDGFTPLRYAAIRGHLDVVKALVEKGADVNATGKEGWTPLAVAQGKGYLEVVKFLQEASATK